MIHKKLNRSKRRKRLPKIRRQQRHRSSGQRPVISQVVDRLIQLKQSNDGQKQRSIAQLERQMIRKRELAAISQIPVIHRRIQYQHSSKPQPQPLRSRRQPPLNHRQHACKQRHAAQNGQMRRPKKPKVVGQTVAPIQERIPQTTRISTQKVSPCNALWNRSAPLFVKPLSMDQHYSSRWVESQVAQTIELWNSCAAHPTLGGPRYTPQEQQAREAAYDQGLQAVEREVRKNPRTKAERLQTQENTLASFARFSSTALDLDEPTIQLLTKDFLPMGIALARWARRFDPSIGMADIAQACRNAWTACGLQSLLGQPVGLTPSILGYSLLYPYSDNYLDSKRLSSQSKLRFSARFRDRLRGVTLSALNCREAAVWSMVELIEGQYPRPLYPQVFDSLLAIHQAQEASIAQLKSRAFGSTGEDAEILRISLAKGGTSVVADACLANPWLSQEENRFAFEWGALLQLGDDLQDVREDLRRGSMTLFSRPAALGQKLDHLAIQLLTMSERVGASTDNLPNGSQMLKDLLKMSWRSLVVRAVSDSSEFFSTGFLNELERSSPFRFAFLRARQSRLTNRRGLFSKVFDAFLEAPEQEDRELPLPDCRLDSRLAAPADSRSEATALPQAAAD